jgi:hypothetical protein
MSMPHPSEIALYWSREDPEICLDPGEPSCFACGFWRESWDHADPKIAWSRALKRGRRSLERAHIFANADGGPAEAGNLVMLCRPCHAAAPMTLRKEDMLAWIKDRKCWLVEGSEMLSVELGKLGCAERITEKVFELDYAQLKRRVSSAARSIGAGLHSGISSHATRALIIKQVHDDLQVDAGTARHSCGK